MWRKPMSREQFDNNFIQSIKCWGLLSQVNKQNLCLITACESEKHIPGVLNNFHQSLTNDFATSLLCMPYQLGKRNDCAWIAWAPWNDTTNAEVSCCGSKMLRTATLNVLSFSCHLSLNVYNRAERSQTHRWLIFKKKCFFKTLILLTFWINSVFCEHGSIKALCSISSCERCFQWRCRCLGNTGDLLLLSVVSCGFMKTVPHCNLQGKFLRAGHHVGKIWPLLLAIPLVLEQATLVWGCGSLLTLLAGGTWSQLSLWGP